MKSLINRHKRNKSKDTSKASTADQTDLNNLVEKEMTQNQTSTASPSLLNKQDEDEYSLSIGKEVPELDLINKMLPKELLIRIFSHLNTVSLCRCAQVSKVI